MDGPSVLHDSGPREGETNGEATVFEIGVPVEFARRRAAAKIDRQAAADLYRMLAR
jgi:hypothetical protein